MIDEEDDILKEGKATMWLVAVFASVWSTCSMLEHPGAGFGLAVLATMITGLILDENE